MNQNNSITKSTRNFGVSTDFSKSVNRTFGDATGRSVSMRTAHGFKNTFKLSDYEMHDDTAEDIVHGGMVIATSLLSAKSDGAKVGGLLLLLGLFLCYQNGK